MQFGLLNQLATYQRPMNKLADLASAFDHLARVCPTINLKQYEFAQVTVTYLGKLVGQWWECPVRAKLDHSVIQSI